MRTREPAERRSRRRPGPPASALLAGALLFCAAGSARAEAPELDARDVARIEARLAPVRPSTRSLVIESGGTAFLEGRLVIPKARLRRDPAEYEGVLTNIGTQEGIVVHDRVDELRFVPRGADVEVGFVYVVSVAPGTRRGGRVRATFALRERFGLANTIAREPLVHTISVVPPEASNEELAADFFGYRYFMARAKARLSVLAKAGLRGLSIQDRGAIPPADRLNAKGKAQLELFEKERRRAWVAHRHLITAGRSSDPDLQGRARAFLKNLAKPPEAWSGLPESSFTRSAEPPPEGKPPPEESQETGDGTLAPVAEYRAGSEGTLGETPIEPAPDEPPPADPATPAAKPEAPPLLSEEERNPKLLAISEGLEPVPVDPTEEARLGRRYYLPSYPRSLLLDDPNIAHGGAVRASYAEVSRPEAASTLAIFYSAQVGLTSDLGLEVTIPTQLVDVDAGRDGSSLYRLGNPLVALKYRLHLPTVLGRKPTFTLRGRWGIAATQQNQIPTSDLFIEEFSQTTNITDTYAFFLERNDVGGGGNLAWRYRWLHLGLQLYLDYLFPSDVATSRADFLAIGYGASVGALPFGELVGFYAETRAVSLVGGPRRTELVVYGGARGRFFDMLEPAVWVGAPIGSTANVSGPQVGLELRLTYDVRSIIDLGGRRRTSAGVPE